VWAHTRCRVDRSGSRKAVSEYIFRPNVLARRHRLRTRALA